MGIYLKKHNWKPCEFRFKIKCGNKKPGSQCQALSRKAYNGKYFCWRHNPNRIAQTKQSDLLKRLKRRAEREAEYNEQVKQTS
jgi:hypothetical protein